MAAGRVPGGVALAPDEMVMLDDTFMFSTLAFYLHTELALTNRRFLAARPSVLLGLIPVGNNRSSYPIENIAGVNAGTRFDFLGVVLGALALLVGLGALAVPNARGLGVLLIALGIAAIVGAPKQYVQVQNSGGGTITFPVSVFERGRTLDFAAKVSEAIARTSRTTGSGRTVSPPASDSDPTSALRRLATLREQGLITDDEYAAKRNEVLSRL